MCVRSCRVSLIITLAVSLAAVFFILAGLSQPGGFAQAHTNAELHVCASGCIYTNVQTAVDAANDGDVIKVAAGIYTGVSAREGITQVVYLDKAVTLQGGYATGNWTTPDPEVNVTTLDAQGQGRVFYISVSGIPAIAGLHITGGNASNQGRDEAGGGIYAEIRVQIEPPDTLIANNHIYSNTAYDGGGVYLDQGAPFALSGNTIISNTAGRAGGGLATHGVEVTLINNVFDSNSASLGGGLEVEYGDAVLQGNTFRGNSAQSAGGGLYVYNSTAKFDTNIVVSNTAQRGGGLAIFGRQDWRDSAWVNTLVADNQASLEGNGIYISGVPLHLWHTTVARNSGGDGSGITIGNWNPWSSSGPSTVDLRNTIVATQSLGLKVTDGSTVDIDSILWHSTSITISTAPAVSVRNQISGDPNFLNPAGGDYHIGAASAAHDAGIVTGTPRDMDGQVRPMGFGYDLGADEYSEAALSLLKTPSLVGANVDGELVYSLVITSSGSQDTHGVVLTDTLDVRQRPILVASPLGNCAIENSGWGGTVVCTPGVLPTGEAITLTLTAKVSATTPLGQAMTNTVAARANEAANSTQAVVYAQDCHVRIGTNPAEYTSIQAAVDAASPGALVKVAGTCMGVSGPTGARQQVYLKQKSLSIQGGYTTTNWTTPDPAAHPTTLDARGLGRVFFIYRPPVTDITLIDGLRITGGNAYGQVGGHSPIQREESDGGGVYIFGGGDQLTLSHNAIFGNTARSGGGMYTSFAENFGLVDNTFTANSVLRDGGGVLIHAGSAALTDNIFDANSADRGGGLWVDASGAVLMKNAFVANTAHTAGGGLFLYLGNFTLTETRIISNTAERGGGLVMANAAGEDKSATLINTIIADNQASVEGAGVYISGIPVHLWHTTLTRNSGGDGSGIATGTFPVWFEPGPSTVVMTNTILAGQAVGLRVTDNSTATINGVLWHDVPLTISQSPSATVMMQNQHTGDPAFLNPGGGDYHIGATSAARDAGVDSGVTTDLDGQVRPMGLNWDIGADEYPAPALSVSSQPSAAFVNRGQVMTYTLGVTDTGAGSAATGVVFTDTLDSWQRATATSASAGICAITNPAWGGTVVCAVGSLSTGATAMVTLTVEVFGTAPLRQAMLNTIVAEANETRNSTAQSTIYAQDCHVRLNAGPTAYASVQTVVDAAGPGDVIKVAGTCLGVSERAGLRQQVYLDKRLIMRGGYTTTNWITPDPQVNPTTLDALGGGRVIYVTGAISPTIEGLRLTGGNAAGLGGVEWGWDAGGGLYVVSATATISNNWIYANTAGDEFTLGGGVFLQNSDSSVARNNIFGNTARYGGGILTLESPAAVSHNTILSNTAIKGGGGVALWGGASVFSGNTIRGNTAHWAGGGISGGGVGATLINNVITDNSADVSGGGLHLDGPAQFWHTTIARNITDGAGDGSGIYVTTGGLPVNVAFTNTILTDHSVGISVTAGNIVTVNGILWHNTPITISAGSAATVTAQHQYSGDPAFDTSGYHLASGSAAIDRGVDAGVLTDIDGETRPHGPAPDLGADEWRLRLDRRLYLPLIRK